MPIHCFFGVQVMLYHKEWRSFLFMKQFRPPVYLNHLPSNVKGSYDSIEWSTYPSSLGYALGSFAGIIDKKKPMAEIVREEILEECGFSVPISKIERVTSYRTVTGATGAVGTLFYAEIDNASKVSAGGGNLLEGERISLEYVPVDQVKQLLLRDETIEKTAVLVFCMYWFFENKYPTMSK